MLLVVAVAAALAWSFWRNEGWLQLCAGLAMFLFGMQCLEEGLRQLAGGRLEQWLARSTGTPARGLAFGIAGTMVLQSSTLVSLLTIAFVSAGLVQLAGGIAIVFGANLGATSGIWLLALAGQDLSLSPLALPMLVFGVLAGFNGPKSKAAGRVVLGVAFVFLGIDQIKAGFGAFGGGLDLGGIALQGVAGTLLFVAAGLAVTVVLQSSHATLMLTLAALAGGQLQLDQGLAIAIGSNVGSSLSTAVVGMLGGNRSGQRLALAHVLFNAVTAILALALLAPLGWLVRAAADLAGFGSNPMLQLALFHTLFNAGGVALFWPAQAKLAGWLTRRLPDPADPAVLTAPGAATGAAETGRVRARHLAEQALDSADAAAAAVALELRHLGRLCMESICRALYLPVERLDGPEPDPAALEARPADGDEDAEALYQRHVKGVYADLLSFMGRLDAPLDEAHQRFWAQSQLVALQLVNAVKDAKHLQKNLGLRLREADSPRREAYLALRRHLFAQLRALYALGRLPPEDAGRRGRLDALDRSAAEFGSAFRLRLFAMVRSAELDGLQAGSLMNDLGYVDRIFRSLREAMRAADEPESLRELRRLAGDGEVVAARA
ncbi:Na/Pi symporter [Luteimonas sp. Y-2-2-4F]|nr:Na/Pi symporter [Luteimonas sp. Y-2-2-4F]MCD9033226.1 Na/Pi symporter [Luteimonas sp. Y-2-2-4F]